MYVLEIALWNDFTDLLDSIYRLQVIKMLQKSGILFKQIWWRTGFTVTRTCHCLVDIRIHINIITWHIFA